MLEGRYKIVFNYVRKQINKGHYKITYDYFGGKKICFDRVIISSFIPNLDPAWFLLPKNKDKHIRYLLTYNCDFSLNHYLRELLVKELNDEQI